MIIFLSLLIISIYAYYSSVVIDIEKDKFEVHDPELRRALHLTTEDLRFTENLIRQVGPAPVAVGGRGMSTSSSAVAFEYSPSSIKHDVFLDGIGWEGGDEWVRAQFRFYLVSLLRTCMNDPDFQGVSLQHFNTHFVQVSNVYK